MINKEEYINLSEEEIKKKLQKFPKKYLFQVINNNNEYKNYSKEKLANLIYTLNFVKST